LENNKELLNKGEVPFLEKRLLVFVNPIGGAGHSFKRWEVAQELLEKAG